MIKKMITASAVVLAVATSAMADGNFAGSYIGGNLGYTTSPSYQIKLGTQPIGKKAHFKGMNGGLHAGYNYQINNLIIGGEASVDLGSAKLEHKYLNLTNTLKKKHAFGLAARLGMVVNNWMPYAKLGWTNAKFEDKLVSAKQSKNLNGFVGGLGIETFVTDNIIVGGEWAVSSYKKHTFNGLSTKPKTHDFKVRLSYKF